MDGGPPGNTWCRRLLVEKKCKFGVHKIIDVCLDICLWSILLESTVTRSRFEPGSPKAQIGTYNGERELLSKRHGYFSGILGLVAQWIRHLTTNQEIAGSSPARIKLLMGLSFTQWIFIHSMTKTIYRWIKQICDAQYISQLSGILADLTTKCV